MLLKIAFIVLISTSAALYASDEPPGTNPCETKTEHRQFDFWVGEWEVLSENQKVAESSIQQIIGSCVVYENYSQKDGYIGKSFNFYDTHLKKWRQTWVDVRGMVSEFSGGIQSGIMQFQGESHYPDGTRALRRMSFTRLDANRVRQSSEISRDDGKTWKPYYELIYVRKK